MQYTTDGMKIEIAMITPEIARTLRDTCHYNRQRNLSEDHIKYLMKEMSDGRFLRGTLIHLCSLDGKLFIVNGNHTLEAISRAGKAIPLAMLYEKVDSEDHMGRIYARHDSGRPRDWMAKLKAIGQGDKLGLSGKWLGAVAGAAPFLDNNLKDVTPKTDKHKDKKSVDARSAIMDEWSSELTMYASLCDGGSTGSKNIMRRSIMIACGAFVLRYQPSTAADFIEGMSKDDGLSQKDPRKRLLEWCRAPRSSAYDHERRFCSAWNAFFEGRTISALYLAGPEVAFKGTPQVVGVINPLTTSIDTEDIGKTSIEFGVAVSPTGDITKVSSLTF